MRTNKIIMLLIYLFTILNSMYGQDTIRLDKKPKITLHSWYPEFKKFPKLKIGQSKVLFTVIPEFEKLSIRNNDIDLKTINAPVQIEETDKTNQYIVTVNPTNAKYIEFEVWLDLQDKTILIKQNGEWKNIDKIYTLKGNRLLIDSIKLELMK